jgi:hypothetical protein
MLVLSTKLCELMTTFCIAFYESYLSTSHSHNRYIFRLTQTSGSLSVSLTGNSGKIFNPYLLPRFAKKQRKFSRWRTGKNLPSLQKSIFIFSPDIFDQLEFVGLLYLQVYE